MKIKRFNKRFNLNKTTISNLNVYEMRSAKGGESTSVCPEECTFDDTREGCHTEISIICFTDDCNA